MKKNLRRFISRLAKNLREHGDCMKCEKEIVHIYKQKMRQNEKAR